VALWTNRYGGTGHTNDYLWGLAVDSNDNVFVAGTAFSSSGENDMLIVKYSGAGVALWTNRYDGTGHGI